jgi:hypothetical protein
MVDLDLFENDLDILEIINFVFQPFQYKSSDRFHELNFIRGSSSQKQVNYLNRRTYT